MKDLTAKEKAKELVDKYSTYVVMWSGGIETSKQNVKQCALIAVEEIIRSNPTIDIRFTKNNCSWIEVKTNISYWLEVKSEIEKL